MENEITIQTLQTCTPQIAETFNKLLSQLNTDIPKRTKKYVQEILGAPNTWIFVALSVDGMIIGMTTLVIFKALSGRRANLEDLVVDKDYRRQGIGRKLLEAALAFAKEEDVGYIDLTSRPSRVEANNLYVSLGFKKRDTNIYRYIMK